MTLNKLIKYQTELLHETQSNQLQQVFLEEQGKRKVPITNSYVTDMEDKLLHFATTKMS